MRRLLLLLATLTAQCAGMPAFADEAAVSLGASAWTRLAVGRPDSAVRYGGRLEVEGPIVVGAAEKAQQVGVLGLSIELESLPAAEGFTLDVASWSNVLQVSGYVGRRVGDAEIGAQRVTTTAVLLGRFATAFREPAETAQRRRFYRAYGAGLLLEEHARGSWILAAYGRDEAVGARGWGQLQLEGEIALAGPVKFYGRAGLGFGSASMLGEQADFVSFGLGVSLPDLVGGLRR